ncbi:FAD:protein FMN transferase [Oscillospiraceae bacterium LTW-04]|nr:FAD:protein FMN transferase [Oscillospiraceae bacterium MB24-C1]
MRKPKYFTAIIIVLCTVMLFGCTDPQDQTGTRSVAGIEFVMNTWVEQRWYGKNAQKTYDEVLGALKELESKLSLYVEESEISRLNSAAGVHPVALSHDTYQFLRQATDYCVQADGLFDITVAPLTLVWNVNSENPRVPSEEEIKAAQKLVDYRRIIFDDTNKTAMLADEGMRIDLGGIAKGLAASLMRQYAVENDVQGYLSIGGNMMVQGKKADGSDYVIGVRDPRGDASEFIASLSLDGLTMATTGDYERYFEQDGVKYHHVMDPFTGYPSATDLISVTVVSEDGTLADYLSTLIFMRGSVALCEYLERNDCMVLAVTKDFEVYASRSLQERLTVNTQKTAYKFNF